MLAIKVVADCWKNCTQPAWDPVPAYRSSNPPCCVPEDVKFCPRTRVEFPGADETDD